MTDRFETILDESISALQAGVSIEDILAEVPEYAAELRPLLYAASVLADPNPELAPEETKSVLRNEYVKQVAELPALSQTPWREKTEAILRILKRRLTRRAILNDLVTVTLTIILTMLMAVMILNYLAADTIPGDFLYSVKRTSENVQLNLTLDEARRRELRAGFNQQRLQEMERLIEQRQVAKVQFNGVLETKGENLWIIEGHTIFLPPDMQQDTAIAEGDVVEVVGLLRANGIIIADTIREVGP